MVSPTPAPARVTVDGKFFRLGPDKFAVRGVAYGPLVPNGRGEPFGDEAATQRDFALLRGLGANVLRVYLLPPRWFLDAAAEHGLRLLVNVPWNQDVCFLDRLVQRRTALAAVRAAALACGHHPAVFALGVANEIRPDIVRWSGAAAVEDHLDELVAVVKEVAPDCLCTFGNFPTTEYLAPREMDFLCCNVYLHQPAAFAAYLARLHLLAGTKPVLLGECGIDSRREGEPRQAELLRSLLEVAFQGGVAGAVVYSFTDEWFKDGQVITDWQFGLTTRERRPKAAFATVREAFHAAPHFPLAQYPRVSVVVACYNGARTLRACLDSLGRLNYPDYEILLVDDGSTDATPQIASLYPAVRCLRHPSNTGLSAARNTGLAAATGEVLAFTDADCRADEDWLYHLVGTLLRGRFAGVGGPNLLPPEDSAVAAAVLVSPGGPAHVMLTDRVAEHLPGCNMAFWKSALLEVGCFDPVFRRAGDDVDICWRLQQNGYALGFSPAGFVWHYRRSTVRDYLKQQRGYGEAEALLERKHPENFSRLGGSIWRGRIYSQAQVGLVTRRPIIYHGLFGGALFQRIYTAPPPATLMVLTSLEYHVFVTAPLIVLAVMVPWLTPLVAASGAISFGVCLIAAAQADVPARQRRFWSRPLVALLFGLQPLARGWARYQGRLFLRQQPLENCESLDSLSLHQKGRARDEVQYAAPPGFARSEFLARALARLDRQGWLNRTDTGWGDYDLEVYGSRWTKLQLTTAAEYYPGGQLLRCRLRPAFTLAARLVFWSLLGLALLATGLAGSQRAWLWLLLLGAPVFALWLHREQRSLQRWFGVFLDKVAEEVGLAPAAVSAGIASAVPAGFPGCAGRAGPRRHESKDHHHAEEGGARSAG